MFSQTRGMTSYLIQECCGDSTNMEAPIIKQELVDCMGFDAIAKCFNLGQNSS